MSGYHILGAREEEIGVIPPYQVLQQQNANLPPGSVPPWYAMQYPAGYVPPLLVSTDGEEVDAFSQFDRAPWRGEREERDILRSHLLGALIGYDDAGRAYYAAPESEFYATPYSANIDDIAKNWDIPFLGAAVTDPNYAGQLAAAFRQKLDETPITYAIARTIAARAIEMTDRAEAAMKARGDSLYGPAMFENPRSHIRWHIENSINKELAGRNALSTPYERADDLKKWATQCYQVLIAVDQEGMLREMMSKELWHDVGELLLQTPKNVWSIVREVPNEASKMGTGLPLWAWSLILVGGVGVLGYAAIKVAPAILAIFMPYHMMRR